MADTMTPQETSYVSFGLDETNLVHGQWTTELYAFNPASSYDWFACCCPCFVMAQVEMHLAALRGKRDLAAFGDFRRDALYKVMITVVFPCVCVWATVKAAAGNNKTVKVLAAVFLTIILALWWYFLVRHMRRTRREIRERLQIPASSCSDTAASLVPVGGVIIQMGRQLDCHKRAYFRSPNKLEAYEMS